MRGLISLSIAIQLLAVVQTFAAIAEKEYNIVDLSHQISDNSTVLAMNNKNEAVGYAYIDGKRNGFVWREGNIEILEPLVPGQETIAEAINDYGVIAGYSYTGNISLRGDKEYNACLWVDTGIVDLGTFGGVCAAAFDINNNNQVSGYYATLDGNYQVHIFLYAAGEMVTLGFPENWVSNNFSAPSGLYILRNDVEYYPGSWSSRWTIVNEISINNRGDVTAGFLSTDGKSFAVVWRADDTLNLTVNGKYYWPMDINDQGFVVGAFYTGSTFGTFTCTYNSEKTILPNYPNLGYEPNQYYAITNSNKDIVGAALNSSTSNAVIWDSSGVSGLADVVDLDTAGWDQLKSVIAINDSGSIVGTGMINGEQHVYMLVPKPVSIEMPVNGKINATLIKASAALISDIYLLSPDSLLLIENNLLNVGTTVDTIYRIGTELVFAIMIHGGEESYWHYSDSKYAKVYKIDAAHWEIHFEDLNEDKADWDFDDVVLSIRLDETSIRSLPEKNGYHVAKPFLMSNHQNNRTLKVYNILGHSLPEHSHSVASGKYIIKRKDEKRCIPIIHYR